MQAVARWFGAVAVGVIVFEGLDLLGSSPFLVGWIPAAASLPSVSPFLCGAAAAGAIRQYAVAALLAAAAAVWARMGIDVGIGMLNGVHPTNEVAAFLLIQGTLWMPLALAGGAGAVVARGALRRIRAAQGRRAGRDRR